MWSDIETSEDLLGYSVHADLLRKVICNPKNLPVTIGLYGDWGSGKSSVLRILEKAFKDDEDTVIIYFDGWSFESFDDAKMALIQGIITKLEDNLTTGNAIKEEVKTLFKKIKKSVNWMRVLQIGVKTALPIAATVATGGAAIGPLIVKELLDKGDSVKDFLLSKEAGDAMNNIIAKGDEEEDKYKAVREFREDFQKLIDETGKSRVIVLIDDLDRCLPRRIIDNLEAIKLFLNVQKTAFIIAADEFIVSNAIKTEYSELIAKAEENGKTEKNPRDLGKSYMEKFIQLPYKLPTLSRKEVESFITLLFCKSELEETEFELIRNDFSEFIKNNKFETYGWDRISKKIDIEKCPDLSRTVGFITKFSNIISNTLLGNPRLIKRFLNAYELRVGLLDVSNLGSQENRFVLLKLMLLEYAHESLFKKLYEWTFAGKGYSEDLKNLERAIASTDEKKSIPTEWDLPDVKYLLADDPKFSSVDLRELYWVSRDNLRDVMGGDSLIPARIKNIVESIIKSSSQPVIKNKCEKQVALLHGEELNMFFDALDNQILINPRGGKGYEGYCLCILANIDTAYNRFLKLVERIDVLKIPVSVANLLHDVIVKYNGDTKLTSCLYKKKELKTAIETAI